MRPGAQQHRWAELNMPASVGEGGRGGANVTWHIYRHRGAVLASKSSWRFGVGSKGQGLAPVGAQ